MRANSEHDGQTKKKEKGNRPRAAEKLKKKKTQDRGRRGHLGRLRSQKGRINTNKVVLKYRAKTGGLISEFQSSGDIYGRLSGRAVRR